METPLTYNGKPMEVGPDLFSLIKKSGLKESKIAEVIGISYASWRLRKLSPGELKVEEIIKLAELLSITPGELLSAVMVALKEKS